MTVCISTHLTGLFATCTHCRGSNISHNAVTGVIPTSIKYMTIVQFVDMSHNQLSGGIPQELQFMASMQALYVVCS